MTQKGKPTALRKGEIKVENSPGLAGSPSTHSSYCTVCASHQRGEKNFFNCFCLKRQQKQQAGWGAAQLVRASLVPGDTSACPSRSASPSVLTLHSPRAEGTSSPIPAHSPLGQSLGDSLSPVATSSSQGSCGSTAIIPVTVTVILGSQSHSCPLQQG